MNLKSVILTIFILTSLFSYSQKIGFHLGVNSSNLLDNNEFSSQDSNYKNVLGLDIGIDVKLKIKKNLYILTGLSFYQNGYQEDEEIFDNGANFASNARLNYLRLPINLLLETNKKNNLSFGFKSGVYFSKVLNKDYFIDTGRPKKELDKIISVGDTITRSSELIEMGDCINCKSLDNRVSVFILIEMFREMKKTPPYDVYGVFTVQEEIGIRGANVSSMDINPDFGFGLDTTIAWDTPGSTKQEQVSALGDGACIKVMDSATVCDYRMVKYMKELSKKKKMKTQLEILPAGGTDTAGIQRMNPGGCIAGAVSIPTRHIHQSIEMVHKKDVRGAIDLLRHSVENLHTYDWSFR